MNTTRVAAYALVNDADRRILLVRIAAGYPAAGVWTLPGGGLRFGEDPQQAVVRELAEETGLQGRVLGLAFVNSVTRDGGDFHSIRIVYDVEIGGGALRDEVDESTDTAAWFDREEARHLPLSDLSTAALDYKERAHAD